MSFSSSYEQIKNLFFEKVSNINTYLEFHSLKNLNFLLLDSVIATSKIKYKIINFDPLYHRYALSSNSSSILSLLDYSIISQSNIFSSIPENELIIVGLDLLPKEQFVTFISLLFNNKKPTSIIFICTNNQSNLSLNNKEQIKTYCNLLLIENTFRKKENNYIVKLNVYNLNKCSKDYVLFIYETISNNNNNNCVLFKFNSIQMYSGELKFLFEEIKKIAEHETTFNVKITEEELKIKNDIVLPYMKTQEEKREDLIEIDQDDIDELYEEDPDEDLDI
jgi:hypothetical protein